METKANFLSAVALSLALMTALGSDELNAQNRLYDNTFSLSDVELLDGPFRHAMDLNVKVLLEYDTDRLSCTRPGCRKKPNISRTGRGWTAISADITCLRSPFIMPRQAVRSATTG